MPALCFLWLHLPVFVFFFSWRVNAVRIAAILTKEAYLAVTIGQTRMLFSFGHIIISFKFRYKNSSQHMNKCSGLCSCSEDDTIFLASDCISSGMWTVSVLVALGRYFIAVFILINHQYKFQNLHIFSI